MRTYTADEVDEMIARALAREREQHKPKEPVARVEETWASENGYEVPGKTELYAEFFNEPPPKGTLLYTSPPASKQWVPLTEFDIDQIPYSCSHADSRLIAFAIEAKLREKNNG